MKQNFKHIIPLKDLNLTDRFLFDEVMENAQTQQDFLFHHIRSGDTSAQPCRDRKGAAGLSFSPLHPHGCIFHGRRKNYL